MFRLLHRQPPYQSLNYSFINFLYLRILEVKSRTFSSVNQDPSIWEETRNPCDRILYIFYICTKLLGMPVAASRKQAMLVQRDLKVRCAEEPL
jgi:hypothetical protein